MAGVVLTVPNSFTLINAAGHDSTVFSLGRGERHVSAVQLPKKAKLFAFSISTNKKPPLRVEFYNCGRLCTKLEPLWLRWSVRISWRWLICGSYFIETSKDKSRALAILCRVEREGFPSPLSSLEMTGCRLPTAFANSVWDQPRLILLQESSVSS